MEADADAACRLSLSDATEFPRRVAATFNYGKPEAPDVVADTLRASEVAFLRSNDDSVVAENSTTFATKRYRFAGR